MKESAWLRCMLCYTLGVSVTLIHNPWIWGPLLVVGITILVPDHHAKIVRGEP